MAIARRVPGRAAVLAAALLLPAVALATLGEPVASVDADRRALVAAPSARADLGRYSVETLGTGAGTVREFVAPSGVVFAIGWSGLSHPDLTPLLGRYTADYLAARRQAGRAPGRRAAKLRGGRLVVERWGHMRDLHGLAYVPALVPSGVAVDELR